MKHSNFSCKQNIEYSVFIPGEMITDFMFSLNRLRKARILICGMNSLGNEVAKNIVLAGVEHMTVLDNTILTEDEKKIQFLPSTSGIGQNVSFFV